MRPRTNGRTKPDRTADRGGQSIAAARDRPTLTLKTGWAQSVQVADDVRHHSLFLVEKGVVDIGPELPEHKGRSVQADVSQPALSGLGPGALLSRIVEIGDA
jgi:hypothetical protein